MRLTGVALWRDSPKFDTDRMLTLLKMREGVAIPTHAAMELASAAERAAGEAEPKVLFEVAFRAMRQPLRTQTIPPPRRNQFKLLKLERGEVRTHRTRECGPW
jgi:hypothetical protein